MKTIRFTAYFCGMSEELFADNILIYKPYGSYEKTYYDQDFALSEKVSNIMERFKVDAINDGNALEDWESENLQIDTIYIRTEDALLGLQSDKLLSDVFAYFRSDRIEFVYVCVHGGASFMREGYRFIVHPNEEVHRYHPHVHVKRNDDETRYSLVTLTRFPNDSYSREFRRDEKKVIVPYLKKNQKKLRRYWDYYINGYIPPEENSDGMQFYKES